jgi:N-methylhydantoinase A
MFDSGAMNSLLHDLTSTAERFVRAGTAGKILREITAFMRYRGQGWEIPVPLPDRTLMPDDAALIRDRFLAAYARFFGRAIDGLGGLEIEIVTVSVKATDERPLPERIALTFGSRMAAPADIRIVFDPTAGEGIPTAIFAREKLAAGDRAEGPAVIVERETSTVVTSLFDAVAQHDGSLLLLRKGNAQ